MKNTGAVIIHLKEMSQMTTVFLSQNFNREPPQYTIQQSNGQLQSCAAERCFGQRWTAYMTVVP